MGNPYIQIDKRKIGLEFEPIVIAEIGINHGGSIDTAIYLADLAINEGAEVIKHQTHIAKDEMSDAAKKVIPSHTKDSIYNIIENSQLSEKDEFKLMQHVKSRGSIFMSTPFSKQAVDRLLKFDVPAFKIGSGECNNLPLLSYIASFGKPIILSTGMNNFESIDKAVAILRKNKIQFSLLHCTNVYPTPYDQVRLDCLTDLKKRYDDAVIGLSDHTQSNYTCLGAISLGASILEKHFTDNFDRVGPDISCSMDPNNLKDLIYGSKILFKARGNLKQATNDELLTLNFANASVVAIKDIAEGEILNRENIWVKRPGNGDFLASDYENLIGKKVSRNIKNGEQIMKDIFN